MKNQKGMFGFAGPALLFALFPLVWTPIQDEGPPPPEEKRPIREIVGAPQLGGDDAAAKMKELFAKVERRLREIDVLLSDASAGDTSKLTEVEEAGIDELLRASLQQGRQLQKEIEEIVALTPP